MRAGESREYLESIQAELINEPDAQLSAWYETEISLQPEYSEAETLQTMLGSFAVGLSGLAEQKSVREEATEEPEPFAETGHEVTDLDEYLTPEQRKRKSVNVWLNEVTAEYSQNMAQARSQTKKSKRDKQESIASKKFVRNFQNYGEEGLHIVYDAEALGYVFEKLSESHTRLANELERDCTQYLHKNGVEFAENTEALADLISGSLEAMPATDLSEQLLSAVFDKKYFVQNPLNAVRLHTALARAALDERYVTNPIYLQKIVAIAYMQTDIIKDKKGFMTAWSGYSTLAFAADKPEIFLDATNARQVFYQAAYATSNDPDKLTKLRDSYIDNELGADVMRKATIDFDDEDIIGKVKQEYRNKEAMDFSDHPQEFDGLEYIDIRNGDVFMPNKTPEDAPDKYRAYFESDLYAKRAELFMPRALAVDSIHHYLQSQVTEWSAPNVFHCPIAAGLSLSFIAYDMEGEEDSYAIDVTSQRVNQTITYLIENFDEVIKPELIEPSAKAKMRNALFDESIELDGRKTYVIALLRRQVPVDFYHTNPLAAMTIPLAKEVMTDAKNSSFKEIERSNAELLDYIKDNSHNYPGRRPIAFEMPTRYKERGLESVSFRVHEDRNRLIVTAHQSGGNIEMVMTRAMQLDEASYDFTADEKPNLIEARFRHILLSLYEQWACRPVIETSEGTVTNEDKRSRVNLGFLRYLPENSNPTAKQAKIFKLEQRGELSQESLRRQPFDPTGLGRNSTYVRETYDPTKPPLDIYYDQSVLDRR